MDTPKEDYFMEMLDSLLEHNHCHGTPLSSKKLQEAVIRVMEDEEKYAERNINNVTTDTSFQSPVTINAQKKYANVTYEGQIASGILAETIKYFKGCRIQSTISDSTHSNSDEQVDAISDSEEQVYAISDYEEMVDAASDPKSDTSRNPKVATHTTNGNLAQKLLKNWFVPKIIQGKIRLIDQLVMEDVPVIRETLGARQKVLLKEIVTDAAHSGAHIFRTLREVGRTGRDGSTPQDVKTAVSTVRLTLQSPNFIGTFDPPTQTGNQDIVSPRQSIIVKKQGTPSHSMLPLINFRPYVGTLCPFLAR